MRISVRSLTALLLAAGVATCSDTPIAAVKQGPGPNSRGGFGRVAVAPLFSKTANFAAAHATDFGISYDSVHIRIRGTPDTTLIVKDTVIHFTRTSADTSIDLLIPVQADGQRFDAAMAYESASGQVFFSGHTVVQSYPPNGSPPANQAGITVNYVGPGSRVSRISVQPHVSVIYSNQTAPFTVSASDSSGAAVQTPPPPIAWSSSDESVGHVSSTGVFTPTGKRGSVTITAITPTDISDNGSATVLLPAASIAVVSGGGQTGKAGTALASPAVVQVSASDGVGISGASVIFSAPAGGSVGTVTASTDANGRASATLKLGAAAGPQSFAATAGTFAVGIPENATAGDAASIAAVAGGGQTDTVRHALPSPLIVRVADQFKNPVPGATVAWAKTGGGSLSAATSVTGADGNASIGYTMGSVPGSETISASVGGVSGSVSFTERAVAAAPANIEIVSGGIQTGVVNAALDAPFVVRVSDVAGNPTQGATVRWSTTSGSIATTSTTDASGQASTTLTLAKIAGGATVTARLANGRSVIFNVTAQPGVTTGLEWRVQPSNATAGLAIAPAMQIAVVDSFGNRTSSVQPIVLALGGGASGATLGGTLTKTPTAGLATFSDITVNRAANGYTLVASMTGPALSATTSTFNVSSASVASMTVSAGDNQTATVNMAVATPLAVVVTDNLGNPITGVSVTFTAASGSGSVTPSGGTATTNALGVAALTSWTLGQTAGAQSLVAAAAGLPSLTFHATAQTDVAAALKITTQPSSSVISGQTFAQQPVIQVVDQFGNAVSAGGAQVTASVSSGTLAGTNPVTPNTTTGVASFTDLKITSTGSVTLTFAAPGMTSATSNSISLTAGTPTKLVFATSPASTTAGASLVATVHVTDAFGNIVPAATNSVALALNQPSGTTDAVLSGTTTVTAASGSTAFSGLSINRAATGYTLTATSSGLTSATTASFNISAAAASKLAFTAQPTSVAANVAIAPAIVAQVQDQFANVVGGATNSISLTSNPSVTLGGTATVAASNGNATFSNITLGTAGSYALTAKSSELSDGTSASFTVSAGSAATVDVSSTSALSIVAGATPASPPTFTVKDGSGNPVAGASVTISIKQGTAIVSSATFPANAVGQVSLGSLPVANYPTTVGTYTIVASSGTVSSTSLSLTVTAGTASKIRLSPSNSAPPAGAEISVTAIATDAFGNTASDAGTRSLSWSATSGSSMVNNGALVQMVSGVGSNFLITSATASTVRVTATDLTSASPLSAGSIDIITSSSGMHLSVSGSAPATSGGAGASVGAPAVRVTTGTGGTGTAVSGVMVGFKPSGSNGNTSKVQLSRGGSASDSILTSTDDGGVASINGWILGNTAGTNNNTLHIAAFGAAEVVDYTASGSAGSAATMTPFNYDANSGYALTAGVPPVSPPGVTIRDANGNPVSAFKLVVLTKTSTGELKHTDTLATGNTGTTDVGGLVTTKAGSYVLVVSPLAGTLTPSSQTFNVTVNPGAATHISINGGNNQSAVTENVVASPPSVVVTDNFDNVVSGVRVTFAVTSGGGTVLPTTAVITGSNGVASATSWKLGSTAGSNTVTASMTVNDATSDVTFTATGTVAVAGLSLLKGGGVGAPSAVSDDQTFTDAAAGGPKVQLIGADSTAVPLAGVPVTVRLAAASLAGTAVRRAPGPANDVFVAPQTISPSTAVTDEHGVADFRGSKLNASVGDYSLEFTATVNGTMFTLYSPRPVHLNHGKAVTATCTAADLPSVVGLSHRLRNVPTLQIFDIDGNLRDTVTETLSPSSGSVLDSLIIKTDGSGTAAGPKWTVGATPGTYTLGVSGATGTCTVKAAVPKRIKLTNHATGSEVTTLTGLRNGDAIPDLDATVVDSDGNAVEDTTFSISADAHSMSGKAINVSSHGKASDAHGKSSFTGLKVDAVSQRNATLDFTLDNWTTIKGTVTFDSLDVGSADSTETSGGSTSGAADTTLSDKFKMTIKDHNGRNGVSGITVAWSLAGGGCSNESGLLVYFLSNKSSSDTSRTDATGTATAPDIKVDRAFATASGACVLSGRATGMGSAATFTISP